MVGILSLKKEAFDLTNLCLKFFKGAIHHGINYFGFLDKHFPAEAVISLGVA